ncbi:bifunctional DNA-formamidopyrimidine glycosylase/DNA-(apurinic or apyrimidinic site) lyase [Rhodoplanes sp. TEM]|uniref:Formamidopyrimidine-DNA glycosylase n=1 Tax=Rhodoplanes tepidamans TaxID=200616 RepID=A0ABT5JGH5_RHOTP|nr:MULTISPECIES: bifunctional DNA-formamidopyrimidine glycosylase/DNA-(apurinic or apyrimidinic site) lyase [Rhodoplanes]MDC7788805.1 bifunctional DNA-formamidopyrimidine glycosylase/DNA-(apurinic or apyrimidinic site) lyase [Rhodoplanes tepidamans]MDC7983160.1 bifunctional DNA-formamidopyrimidine glycosylase/DNA-(apurinic or apyrimidinic site) lyase [Rhodoplanes sp. TEM]MDQ0357618.1 formamidopyrimidine-DNA glycosylase [Rhodoplanes tepidamans]
MPELPEVETVRRGLAPAMEGARFVAVEVRRPDLRRPFPNDFRGRLEGATVMALRRRAKYLLADLSTGEVLLMHLGMSGSFRVELGPGASLTPGAYYHARSETRAHDHVVFAMSSGARLIFNDPRRFGLMLLVPAAELHEHPLMREVGPEPLDPGFDAARLALALAGKAAPLKAALLDQTVVAGLGNIYVCEALHLSHLSPRRKAGTLVARGGVPTPRLVALVEAVKAVLADAIAAGGSSLRDHRQTDGTLGLFQHRFRVYDREGEPCATPGCAGTIRRIVQSGRSTFFCPVCQK